MRLLRETPRARRRETTIVALFSATLFLSAGLVFLVQPMYAKFILPLFGSTPAVWNASMLFFQTTLLAGYLLAVEPACDSPIRGGCGRPATRCSWCW